MTEMPLNSHTNGVSQTEEPENGGIRQSQRARQTPRSQNCACAVTILRRNAFVVLTVAAVVIGFVLGLALQSSKMTARDIRYLSFPGELLMRMLQMLVLPLIVSSLVTGIASLDSKASGRMGMQAIVYYMVTTIIAVFTGVIIVVILQPGNGPRDASVPSSDSIQAVQIPDAFMDLIRNMFPSNLVEASFKQYKTIYSKRVHQKSNTSIANLTETNGTLTSPGQTSTIEDPIYEMVPIAGSYNGVNALGLVVFSISFGLVLGSMKKQGQPLRDFFDCLNKVIMRLVSIIIWYAPVGILFLIAGKMVEMRDMGRLGGQLGMYTLCVITGLLFHGLLILPLLYFITTHKNPYLFIAGLLQALLTALGTSSSSASLPITFRCLEDNNGMDKRVTRFMLPVGATINMDGTALYEAVAVVFIAQVNNLELNLGQIITISITATAASIGAAAIPQAGLVTMVIVLTSVGLPTEDITLIIAVDWFLDRLRTCTNVLGDSIGVGIVEHLSRQQLQSLRTAGGNSDLEGRGKLPQHRDNDRPFHHHHHNTESSL